ncbi:hypothetical protein PC112_g5550 [Phytophthora cactorum]|nr:hypothetical protein PC112_g5550 [Phytophthora cactorum]
MIQVIPYSLLCRYADLLSGVYISGLRVVRVALGLINCPEFEPYLSLAITKADKGKKRCYRP